MLYFVHEIGPFHGQIPLELIFVHETCAFHGLVSSEPIFVHEAGSFYGRTFWGVCLWWILGFCRALIQRWQIRKGIPRIHASYYADFSLFYNDSIFFIMYGGSVLPGFHIGLGRFRCYGSVPLATRLAGPPASRSKQAAWATQNGSLRLLCSTSR